MWGAGAQGENFIAASFEIVAQLLRDRGSLLLHVQQHSMICFIHMNTAFPLLGPQNVLVDMFLVDSAAHDNRRVLVVLDNFLNLLRGQLLVSCGGGRRLADGLRKQHVRTIRLPVWDTLEDFSPYRTSYVGRRQHVTRTYVDEGRISIE